MKLIDKDKVIAEIERIKKEECPTDSYEGRCKMLWFEQFSSFLDTLETKEADLDSDIRTYLTNNFNVYEDGVLQSKKSELPLRTYDIIKVAEHFFELGLKAQSSSVWHYVSTETPTKFGESIIIASKNNNEEDGIWLYDLIQSWEGEWSPRVNWEAPIKWAYMDDLF